MSAKTLIFATAALAAAATALPALAAGPNQPGPGPNQPPAATTPAGPNAGPNQANQKLPLRAEIMFSLLDRNGDGVIEKDELNVLRDAIFAALDTNGDGQLSKQELEAAGPMFGGPRHGMADFRHHDHGPRDFRMGRNEQPGNWQGRFGDGQGRFDNRPAWPQRWQQFDGQRGMMGRTGFNGAGPGQGYGQGAGQGQQGAGPGAQSFASLDTNGDGVVSQDEFAVAPLPFLGPMQQR